MSSVSKPLPHVLGGERHVTCFCQWRFFDAPVPPWYTLKSNLYSAQCPKGFANRFAMRINNQVADFRLGFGCFLVAIRSGCRLDNVSRGGEV